MKCPKCGSKSRVLNTTYKREFTTRYRECHKCKRKFTTRETLSDGLNYKAMLKKIKEMVKEVK